MEYLPDVDLCQLCEALTYIEHWMGTSYHISCEIMDAEGLHTAGAKPRAPPAQDAKWINYQNIQIISTMSLVGRFHMHNEELNKPRGTTPNPCILMSNIPSYPVYTAAEQDLGLHY